MLAMLQTGLLTLIARLRSENDGAAMVEYGLLVGLIALVVALAALFLGHNISTMFSEIGSYLSGIAIP